MKREKHLVKSVSAIMRTLRAGVPLAGLLAGTLAANGEQERKDMPYGTMGHVSPAVTMDVAQDPNRCVVREPLSVRLLRGLQTRQAKDGSWKGGKSVLVDTALAVMAVMHHNSRADIDEFRPLLVSGMRYMSDCVCEDAGPIRFRGEEADPRAFFMAATVMIEGSRLYRPDLRGVAENCVTRLVGEAFPCLTAELDDASADHLRWLEISLETARECGYKTDGLMGRLSAVHARLEQYGKGDGGYYDAWSEYTKAFVVFGGDEYLKRWSEGQRARLAQVGAGVVQLQTEAVKDEQGRLRGVALVRLESTSTEGLRASGLGEISDTALRVLIISWPLSHRIVPSCPMAPVEQRPPDTTDDIAVEVEI